MKINLITAMDNKNGIGIDNALPWNLPSDLKYFKGKTLNQVVVMGRKTLDSLPGILPMREHWVLSSKKGKNDKVLYFDSIESMMAEARKRKLTEIWIIGGGIIYEQFLSIATDLWITQVQAESKANRFFPAWQRRDFKLEAVKQGMKEENDQHDFIFYHWTRV